MNPASVHSLFMITDETEPLQMEDEDSKNGKSENAGRNRMINSGEGEGGGGFGALFSIGCHTFIS